MTVPDYGFYTGARPINRVPVRGRPEDWQTWQVAAPHDTHYRRASCAEVDCWRYLDGWRVHVQALTEEQRHAVLTSRYLFRVVEQDADHTFWDFEPGQRCFEYEDHRVPTGRPALFLLRRGDFRASEIRHRFASPEAWRDDFAEHQDKIAATIQKG